MRKIRILATATQEASEAAAWYEQEKAGLGGEFFNAIEAALDLLEQGVVPLAPMPGITSEHVVKRLVLKRFPYALIVLERKDEIVVLAFAHHSRRPGYWRNRIKT